MEFYTAQFSQIRYLEPYMIPFSTAAGEPSWYHDFKDRDNIFIDKHGVINGLVAQPLLIDTKAMEQLFDSGCGCSKPCPFLSKIPHCPFMDLYRENLDKHDINDVLDWFNKICNQVKNQLKFKEEPIVILLVYEAAEVPCAERIVIQNYFKSHGITVKEFTKDLFTKETLF